MEEAVRQFVRERAGNRCEYCRLPQAEGAGIRFHVEHVRPRQHGGGDEPSNLALACPTCNWHKGPNLSAVDPVTNTVVPLFSSREDRWEEHLSLVALEIVGLTTVGRATARLLGFNHLESIEVRRELAERGELDLLGLE